MKKYIIVLVVLLICCGIIMAFSVPDRIKYAFNGMAGYDLSKYEQHTSKMEKCTLDIDFSTYQKKPITVCKYNDKVYIDLDKIVFNGGSYTFYFTSYGNSTFRSGNIILIDESISLDVYIKNELGEFVFQLTGASGLENDIKQYSFDLYPNFENCDVNAFSEMSISIPIDNITLVSYERK